MKVKSLVLLFGIFLGGGLLFSAQDAPRRAQTPGEGGPRPERREFAPPRPGAGMGAALLNDPSFTEEQRRALREVLEPDRDKQIELYRKLAQARRALQEATFAEKMDADAIRNLAAELGKAEGELSLLRAAEIAKLRPKLSAEQLDRLKNNPLMGGVLPGMLPGQRPGGDDGAPRRPFPPEGRGDYRRGNGDGDAPRRPNPPPPADKP